MLPDRYTVEFKEEDWHDAIYPIRVRISNMREKCAEHAKHGLPAPPDHAALLDDLCTFADCCWAENATRNILRNMTPDDIEDCIDHWQAIVCGKKPITYHTQTSPTYGRALEEWRRNTWFLTNLYAAWVFYKQIDLLKQSGRSFDSNDNRLRPCLHPKWKLEFGAWDATIKQMYDEEHMTTAVLSDGFDREEANIINGFASRIRQIATEQRDNLTVAQEIAACRETHRVQTRYPRPVVSERRLSTQGQDPGTGFKYPAEGKYASSAIILDDTQDSDAATQAEEEFGRPAPIDQSVSGLELLANNGVPTDEGGSTELNLDDPKGLVAGEDGSHSLNISNEGAVVDLVGDDSTESFMDANGRMHFRGHTGRFVKKADSAQTTTEHTGIASKKWSLDKHKNIAGTVADAQAFAGTKAVEEGRPKRKRSKPIRYTQDQEEGTIDDIPAPKKAKRTMTNHEARGQETTANGESIESVEEPRPTANDEGKTGEGSKSDHSTGSVKRTAAPTGTSNTALESTAIIASPYASSQADPTQAAPRKKLILKNSGPKSATSSHNDVEE